jgi:RNA 3'-terminal phosphate cyclase (ATP)
VLWAPPYPFLQEAWLPLVRRANAQVELELVSSGFHPAGGGEVAMSVQPTDAWGPLHLGPSSVLAPLELKAIVSGLSEGIARRELSAAAELLSDSKLTLASETVRSPGPGNAMWLIARDEATGLANVFSGIGDPGVKSEDIGQSVAKSFLAWRASGAAVEEHLADQLMLPIAVSASGSYTTNVLSLHAKTNIEVIHAFTGKRFRCFDEGNSRVRIELEA